MIHIITFVLFLSLIIVDCKALSLFFKSDVYEPYNASLLVRFFLYYRNYFYVIHEDILSSSINVASILKMFPPYQIRGEGTDDQNSGAANTVNTFFIPNISHMDLFLVELKVFNQDGCNLFLTYEISEAICSLHIANLAPASYVFNVKNNQLFSCFNEKAEMSFSPVEEAKMNSLHLFHKSYNDLGGRHLKIYFLNNQGTICREVISGKLSLVEKGRCNPLGPESELVRLLGRRLNFVPEFWLFEDDDLRKRWIKMIDAIGRGEADFSVGSISLAKDGSVYYTSFTHSSAEYVTYFVNPTKQLNLTKILISFDLSVYIISLLCLIVILLLAITFIYVFGYRLEYERCVLTLLKMVVEQGSDLNPHAYSFNTMKLIIGLWLFFSIIFCTVLKSRIASGLIKQETYDFKSVKELSENGYSFVVQEKYQEHFIAKYVPSYNIKFHRGLKGNYENVDICPLTLNVFQHRYAIVHGEFDLVVVTRLCKDFFPKNKINDQRFLMDGYVYYALAMNPLSPYNKKFSSIIDRLKASGIMVHWYSHLNSHWLTHPNQEFISPMPFTIDQVLNIFILLFSGLGIGFVVFILEIMLSVLIQ